ncbi:TPA: hypothetical protein QHB43_001176 [Aeromonas hydrophila subsp. hydrophila]|nr:hypothetical protein [Aeromonas hydrophila subsp. hydrophila]
MNYLTKIKDLITTLKDKIYYVLYDQYRIRRCEELKVLIKGCDCVIAKNISTKKYLEDCLSQHPNLYMEAVAIPRCKELDDEIETYIAYKKDFEELLIPLMTEIEEFEYLMQG